MDDHELSIRVPTGARTTLLFSKRPLMASTVVITNEISKTRKDKDMPKGKRHGGRTPHLRSVPKGSKKQAAKDEAKPEDATEKKDEPKERKPRAVVSRMASGKQGELPGVKVSDRKIAEIEDLAVIWEDTKLALARRKAFSGVSYREHAVASHLWWAP